MVDFVLAKSPFERKKSNYFCSTPEKNESKLEQRHGYTKLAHLTQAVVSLQFCTELSNAPFLCVFSLASGIFCAPFLCLSLHSNKYECACVKKILDIVCSVGFHVRSSARKGIVVATPTNGARAVELTHYEFTRF